MLQCHCGIVNRAQCMCLEGKLYFFSSSAVIKRSVDVCGQPQQTCFSKLGILDSSCFNTELTISLYDN